MYQNYTEKSYYSVSAYINENGKENFIEMYNLESYFDSSIPKEKLSEIDKIIISYQYRVSKSKNDDILNFCVVIMLVRGFQKQPYGAVFLYKKTTR